MKILKIALTAAAFGFASQAFAQSDGEKEGWYFQQFEETIGSLYYGAQENEELLTIAFICDQKAETVDVLMREAGEGLKADDRMCVFATTDGQVSDLCGTAIPNELAGIADFDAIVSRRLPLFRPVKDEAGNMTLSIRNATRTIPLKGFNAAYKPFAKVCFGAGE